MRNKYPGKCYRCGGNVGPGDGHFERIPGGWRVQHAECAIQHRIINRKQKEQERKSNASDT